MILIPIIDFCDDRRRSGDGRAVANPAESSGAADLPMPREWRIFEHSISASTARMLSSTGYGEIMVQGSKLSLTPRSLEHLDARDAPAALQMVNENENGEKVGPDRSISSEADSQGGSSPRATTNGGQSLRGGGLGTSDSPRLDLLSELDFAVPPELFMNSLDSMRCSCTGGNAGLRRSRSEEACCSWGDTLMNRYDAPNGIFFITVGDSGLPGKPLQQVSDTVAEVCSKVSCSFVAILGDNKYPSGFQTHDEIAWENVIESPFGHRSLQKVAFYPVLGNHDYGLNPMAQIDRFYTKCSRCRVAEDANEFSVRWRFPNTWYMTRHIYHGSPLSLDGYLEPRNAADIGRSSRAVRDETSNVTVASFFFDSMIMLDGDDRQSESDGISLYRMQLDFLKQGLQAASQDADWILLFGHHPVFTDARTDRLDPNYVNTVLELVTTFQVDAFFSGHEHLLSLFELSEIPDTAFVISGSASKVLSGFECKRETCKFLECDHGFTVQHVTKNQMRIVFVNRKGDVLYSTIINRKRRRHDADESVYPPIQRVILESRGVKYHYKWIFTAISCIFLIILLIFVLCRLCNRGVDKIYGRRSESVRAYQHSGEMLPLAETEDLSTATCKKTDVVGSDKKYLDVTNAEFAM